MGIGMNFKNILNNKNMTVQYVSRKTGISPNTLYGIIKRDNETVKPDILEKLSKALDVQIWELLGLEKSKAIDKAWTYKEFGDMYSDEKEKEMDKAILKSFQEKDRTERLLKAYNKLNVAGKKEAIKRIEELCLIAHYQSDKE